MESISLITTLFIVFAAAIGGAIVAKKLSVPMLVGYIVAGIVAGNLFPAFIDERFLGSIADIGVTLLLFTLGVEFSFHRLAKVLGMVAGAAVVQILVTILIFFLLFLTLHVTFVTAVFLAVAIAFSSTAVVVKILSERGELVTIPGEVLTGWLVVQDLSVIPIMLILPALVAIPTAAGAVGTVSLLAISVAKAVVFLLGILFLGRTIPAAMGKIASYGSREIFLLFTVAIVFLAGAASFAFGLPAALGAFIAGLLISETSQNHAVFSEIRPLRDIFAVLFFVAIGMSIPVAAFVGQMTLLVPVATAVLLVKWSLVMAITRYLGYHRKTSFLVSLGLLPMSEFGFIIARTGVALNALGNEQYVFLVSLTFLTIFVASPLLTHGQRLYYWWQKNMGKYLPRIFSQKDERLPDEPSLTGHVVICGYGRVGKYVGRALSMANIPFLVIDYNHATVASVRGQGISVLYGDPADPTMLKVAGLGTARAIIIAIADLHTQELVIAGAQTINKHIRIICRTHYEEDQARLKSLRVTTIVQPEFEAALTIVERLLPDFGVEPQDLLGKIARLKIEHGVA